MGDFSAEGGYFNHVLYRMCSERPLHNDVEIVAAKTQLIGRAYAVAPSRGAGKRDQGQSRADFYRDLAQHIVARGEGLDQQIAEANSLDRISQQTLPRIAEIQNELSTIIATFARDWGVRSSGRSVHARSSFASKYLHFHARSAFFILDSVIIDRLKRCGFVRYRPKYPEGCRKTDYARLCLMLLEYARRDHTDAWTPRSIDGALYSYPVMDTTRANSINQTLLGHELSPVQLQE